MTVTIIFAAFLALSASFTLVDWRRGWLLAILCGVLQDPARKLTAGTPVVMSISIVLIYAFVVFSAQVTLHRHASDFTRRFSGLYGALIVVFVFLFLAAING